MEHIKNVYRISLLEIIYGVILPVGYLFKVIVRYKTSWDLYLSKGNSLQVVNMTGRKQTENFILKLSTADTELTNLFNVNN